MGPLIMDVVGKELQPLERDLLQHPQVSGVILFARNYESRQQVKDLIQQIRQAKTNLLILVDQEGGRVQRFRDEFTRLPPLAEFGKVYQQNPEHALQLAEQSAYTMASELKAVGVDMSFSPVLDVDQGVSLVIGDRSFASDPKLVTVLAAAYIKGMHSAGMPATGKHFPGHGAVAADSHKELPVDKRSFADIWQCDLLPYRELTNQLDAVMVAHVVYPKINKKPASFSRYWLHDVLRQQIQFKGIIFSDDLSMLGAAVAGNVVKRMKAALKAGCDRVLLCNDQPALIKCLDKIIDHKKGTPSTVNLE
jgi:beta-N-acetylhexosaminidase